MEFWKKQFTAIQESLSDIITIGLCIKNSDKKCWEITLKNKPGKAGLYYSGDWGIDALSVSGRYSRLNESFQGLKDNFFETLFDAGCPNLDDNEEVEEWYQDYTKTSKPEPKRRKTKKTTKVKKLEPVEPLLDELKGLMDNSGKRAIAQSIKMQMPQTISSLTLLKASIENQLSELKKASEQSDPPPMKIAKSSVTSLIDRAKTEQLKLNALIEIYYSFSN